MPSENKRINSRINAHLSVRMQVRGRPDFKHTVSDNISVGGARLINDTFLPLNTALSLDLKIMNNVLHPAARVVWSQPLPHSDRYGLGVEFTQMSGVEEDFLSDYIDMLSNKL
ncbi:MAG: PilZ domain-containing protein [Candidatus Omnitrophica bacterium]|nr:PilZ domain-containing protein [Candidatus Omnitrophota bacterium]